MDNNFDMENMEFEELDLNKDGIISKEEFEFAQSFGVLNKDNNMMKSDSKDTSKVKPLTD